MKNPLEGNVNVDDDEDKCTPSHCIKGAQATETLIEAGANVNADDKDKCTPPHIATQFCRKEIRKSPNRSRRSRCSCSR